jgi:hypothetical protein
MTDSDIQNVDDWITSLYKDCELVIEYAGKNLVFNKRFPTGLVFRLKDKSEAEQAYAIISIVSKSPHITPEQAARLPMDLLAKIMIGLELDPALTKKLIPKPN